MDTFLSSPPLRLMDVAPRAPAGPCFTPGEIVAGRFRIEACIGSGGMGDVFQATDLELAEPVALKTIRSAMADSAAIIERFKREVSQTRRITHPNVCRVYDLFRDDRNPETPVWFLTMELLNGQTLREHIAEHGPMSADRALPLIRQIVEALGVAHRLGIVHRDLKTSNVMLVREEQGPPRAVVMDFGLAVSIAHAAAESEAGPSAGTPGWMAPEQWRGEPAGFGSDQFALGLVMCEILTGGRPRLDRDFGTTARRQLEDWLNDRPRLELPPYLRKVVARCLEFQPKDRYARVRDILPLIDPDRPRRRIRRVALWAAAAVVGGASAFALLPDSGERPIGEVPLTGETGMAATPSISARGDWVAYVSDRGEPGNLDIWLTPFGGGSARRLTTHPAIDSDPALSPDGALVAFRSDRDAGGLYLVPATGGPERLLAPGGRDPAFAPDGRHLVYWTGTRDLSAPSGRLYIADPSGGSPVRLAPDFADARFPTWSPDSRWVLFEGCRTMTSAVATCADWWVVPAGGGAAVQTGLLPLLKSLKVEVQAPPVKSWRGNEIFFSAAEGSAMAIWAARLSGDLTVAGTPRRVTRGDARERVPSIAADGRMVFGRATGALHVWRVPTGGGAASGPARVTNDAGLDCCPGVSKDGKWLYFSRKLPDGRTLMAMDVSSANETPVLAAAEELLWPVPDSTGGRVAVEARGSAGESIWVVERGGGSRVLCSRCSHPTSWVHGSGVLYTAADGAVAQVDAATGQSREVLKPEPGVVISGADWSPAHGNLVFTVSRHGEGRRGFIAAYPAGSSSAGRDWLPLSADLAEIEQPHWSPDGRTVYFLSKRDGNNCLWSVGFDAGRRRVSGPPSAVAHFHDPRTTPERTSPFSRGLAAGPDAVYLNIGEVTSTVWSARLAPPWWAFWRRP